ncbi:protein Wnt-7b isoform X1 [Argonauta hians]
MGAKRQTKFIVGIVYLCYCVYGNFLALSSVVAFGANIICNKIPDLVPKQRSICQRRPDAIVVVGEGVKLGVQECRHQFRYMRWNCTLIGSRNSLFAHVHLVPNKEAAFSFAIVSAGIAYAITQACSRGNLNRCGCDKSKLPNYSHHGWKWGGCSADVKYGLSFSRNFVDIMEFTENARALMNVHNNRAGRKAVKENVVTECKCHGVSGSCTMKTCWTTLRPFRMIGNHLMKKYKSARLTRVIRGSRSLRPVFLILKKSKKQNRKPRRSDLVCLEQSPNYCDYDSKSGSLGTVGRKCLRESKQTIGCDLMCCGRGYNTHQYTKTIQCRCKFYWCCFVKCQQCSNKTEEYTCK